MEMKIYAWLVQMPPDFDRWPQIKPGTLIYFDEMNHLDHELRAFEEFTSQNSIKFRSICADKTLAHVSFECTN